MSLALRTFDSPRPGSSFYAAPIADATRLDVSNPKWVQLCAAGQYVYRGTPVEISPATLDAMVSNFRRHPSYDAGARTLFGKPVDEAAKLGAAITSGVIALNFDHPPVGTPRPGHGWFLELERRGAALWGLVWMDPEAFEGMASARWKWTSIEWSAAAKNNQGADIGPYLSGVALTNDPFVQGMVPIQMSRTAAPVVWFGSATSALHEIRDALALPETADMGAVLGELSKLRTWTTGGVTPPLGVDVAHLMGRLRRILNLPTLSEPASIFGELEKLLGQVADEQETQENTMADDKNQPPTPSVLARTIAPRLSAILRTAVEPTDGEVLRHFDGAMGRYDEAMGHVNALAKTFGTTDAKAIAEKLASLMALGEQMTALLGEVAAEHVAEEKAEGEMAAADVAQVMSAQRLDPQRAPGTFQAYTAQRLGFAAPIVAPTPAEVATEPAKLVRFFAEVRKRGEVRRDARKSFFTAHGIDTIVPVPQHLQHLYGGTTLFAGGGAVFSAGNVGNPQPHPQGHPQPGMSFGGSQPGPAQGYPGAPLQHPNAQTAPQSWSWSRVGSLPPSQHGDNAPQRIFEEVARAEFGGNVQGPRYDQCWARANAIHQNLLRSEGAPPPQLFMMA